MVSLTLYLEFGGFGRSCGWNETGCDKLKADKEGAQRNNSKAADVKRSSL
jgi:hypothetical protein